MKPRSKYGLWLACLLCLGGGIARADVRDDVTELMGHVRHHEVVDDAQIRRDAPGEVLAELVPFLGDPDRDVRVHIVSVALGVAQRNPASPELRCQSVAVMMQIVMADADESISAYAADRLVNAEPYFGAADFSEAMQSQLLLKLKAESPRREFMLLAGVVQARAAQKRLQALTGLEAGMNVSWWQRNGWVAHVALARLGVESEAVYVASEFSKPRDESRQDETIKVSRLLKDMAYIRHPLGVEILQGYLFSEQRLPSSRDETQPGTPYAQYALEYLSEFIEGFPVKTKGLGYSDAEVNAARVWMKANEGKFKIKR